MKKVVNNDGVVSSYTRRSQAQDEFKYEDEETVVTYDGMWAEHLYTTLFDAARGWEQNIWCNECYD